MRVKAFAVIDTNVVVSGMLADGFPRRVLELIMTDNVIPVFDERVLNEYLEVLSREKFRFSKDDVIEMIWLIAGKGIFIKSVDKAIIQLNDRKDIPFFEVKESSGDLDTYLVTGNLKHFPESASTVSPKEMMNILNYLDRFIKPDFDYDKIFEELKQMKISSEKYGNGTDYINSLLGSTDTER